MPNDSLAWATLLRLQAGIGHSFIDHVYQHARANELTFGSALLDLHEKGYPEAPQRPARLGRALIDRFLSWSEEVEIPDERPEEGWGAWLLEIVRSHGDLAPTVEFQDLFAEVDGVTQEERLLDHYLGQLQPLGRDLALARSGGVRIMTIAGSKGLTVRATIVVGVEEAFVPRPQSDTAEERRLLYVGMTRAREHLYCTFARRRHGPTARSGAPKVNERRQVSQFLRDGPIRPQDGDRYIGDRWDL